MVTTAPVLTLPQHNGTDSDCGKHLFADVVHVEVVPQNAHAFPLHETDPRRQQRAVSRAAA